MTSKIKIGLTVLFVGGLFVSSVLFARHIEGNESVQELVSSFGYFGILLVSFVGGLNLAFPIPASAFIPVFIASGFKLYIIIGIIVFGTTLADLISYYIGTVLKPRADKSHNKILELARKYCLGKRYFTAMVVFLYAAFVPFPNEVLLLPLGTLGFKLRYLIAPFVLGTIIHISIIAYSVTNLI